MIQIIRTLLSNLLILMIGYSVYIIVIKTPYSGAVCFINFHSPDYMLILFVSL